MVGGVYFNKSNWQQLRELKQQTTINLVDVHLFTKISLLGICDSGVV